MPLPLNERAALSVTERRAQRIDPILKGQILELYHQKRHFKGQISRETGVSLASVRRIIRENGGD